MITDEIPGLPEADNSGGSTQTVESQIDSSSTSHTFEGHVDFYGYHTAAEGWFVGGWVSHPWRAGQRPQSAVAEFDCMTAGQHLYSVFYHRDDVSGRGIGFVFFIESTTRTTNPLSALRLTTGRVERITYPSQSVAKLDETRLVEHLRGILQGDDDGSPRHAMRSRLTGKRPSQQSTGYIDRYGYHSVAGGWLLCGWLTIAWREAEPPISASLTFEEGHFDGQAFGIIYARQDLQDGGEGLVLFIRGDGRNRGRLVSVSFEGGGVAAMLVTGPTAARLRETDLVPMLRPHVTQGFGMHRDFLPSLLARQPYRGENTLADLDTTVFLEIDEAIATGANGLLLMGWFLAHPGEVSTMRVHCGPLISPLDLTYGIQLDRPDVVEGFAKHGFSNKRCGFITFLPNAILPNMRAYVEVETSRYQVAFHNIPRPNLQGIPAIKRVLAAVDLRFTEVADAYDRVLGPAIYELNAARLAKRPSVTSIDYGQVPVNPRHSVIVPLYGRLDFVEYQLALFSAHPGCSEVEFIYVLDEPARRREAQFLFASVYERFGVPFRALLLDENVGFAPANNIGLHYANGFFVAFINSDVFPGTPDWLAKLSARLISDQSLGVVGPALLFEDDTIQHHGMRFERLPEFGNWYFGLHKDKGLRYRGHSGLETHLSITGACMVMTRLLAQQVGGFDESYVIGDFEDSDLCFKVQALGYRCAVDPSVRLYHLERKSQAGPALTWRMNLTVYNAWQHERRWGDTIQAKQDAA